MSTFYGAKVTVPVDGFLSTCREGMCVLNAKEPYGALIREIRMPPNPLDT